ncbi:MAG: hypothetical protein A2901_02330 [Elusimicrobia bacterium RIFCSPLOWO2_01_FULL_54_10]|nr:MAG: hypothetical protein A2901_02330 [Elusimicrobia bacterium RIFCSPLOWO2_01_FULL_54_10]
MNIKRFAIFTLVTAGLAGGGFYLWKIYRHTGHETAPAAKTIYHCPMHPTYISDKPGDCPICGMKLVLIEEEKHEAAVSDLPEGRAPVSLTQERQQLIGVRTSSVSMRDMEIIVRASGRVAYDPDLYNAIVEHVEALKAKEKTKGSPMAEVHERADSMVRSSGLRLRQMGLSQPQIDEMTRKTKTPTNLLLSEKGGAMWIYAQIYEHEAGLVKSGQMMDVISSANPGRTLSGKVIAVDTILNPETRTLRVRGEIPNPEGLLQPEMYVDALIHVNLGNKLAVPKEAVLDSGQRKIIFVEESPGRFTPREIRIGKEAESFYEVVSGVVEGENVVVSANFLLDSESRIKSSLSQSGAGHSH